MSDTCKEEEAQVGEHHHTEEEWETDNKDSSSNKQTTTRDSGIPQQALQTSADNKNISGDGDGFLLKKIIVDDERHSRESVSIVEDAVIGLSYQDHNYGRRSGNAQKNDGENGEKFPIIGGLASYIGNEISKVPAGHHFRDTNLGHFSRSHNSGTHYRKISGMDSRTSCRIYSGGMGGCRTSQMRRLPASTEQIFPRQTSIIATQNYRIHRRGVTQISANSHSDILFRSRHFVSSGGTFATSASSNKRVLRPAHPPNPVLSTCHQSIRQIIPASKSVSATMPAYAMAVNATGADSETHATDMSVGLAPFLVPSRRPRPVVRNRARASSQPDKGTELLIQKLVASDQQADNALHAEKQPSNVFTASGQHLPKNVIRSSGIVKQQYIMAEPLEPCHVPRLQHSAQQRAVPNDLVISMVVDEKLSPESLHNSAVHCKEEEQKAFSQSHLSSDSRESIYVNSDSGMHDLQQTAQTSTVLSHRLQQDIGKYVEEHYRKSQKDSFVANSRHLFTRQLDELQIRQSRLCHSETSASDSTKKMKEMDRFGQQSVINVSGFTLYRQKSVSPGHVAFNQNRGFDSRHSTSVEIETPVLPSKNRTESDDIQTASDGEVTLKRFDHGTPSVEDILSGEGPVFNEVCNEVVEQRISVATRSSISGAEEETSVNDNVDEKETEDEGFRTTIVTTGVDSSSNSNSEDDWEEEYTTRCYCGLNHNDEFMIQCDVCNVWQHGKCVGIDRRRVPDTYQCEECNPRLLKLSKTQAREMQLKILARYRKEKEKKRRQRAKGRFKKRIQEKSGDPALLEALRNGEGVSVMYVTQLSMGLVSTRLYHADEPVIYICGRVSLPCECHGREEPGVVIPFVTLYSHLVVEESKDPIPICIDARRFGSKARFARASCRPNIKMQHFFLNGKLHIIGIAVGNIERGEEITVPFDDDYYLSKTKLICACSADDEHDGNVDCLVRNFNRMLEQKQNSISDKALNTASNPMINFDTTSEDHTEKQYVDVEVGKVRALMKSRNTTSGSRYSSVTFLSRVTASDYIGEVNTMVETATAVTPTTEDENTINKDVLPESSVEIQLHTRTTVNGSSRKARKKRPKISSTTLYRRKGGIKLRCRGAANYRTMEIRQEAYTNDESIGVSKGMANVDNSLKKETCLFSDKTSLKVEEQYKEKRQVGLSKEYEGQFMESGKFITEKLRAHADAEEGIENVQKSSAVEAGPVVAKNVGRPRKKRRSISARVADVVNWAGETDGNEDLVVLDSSAIKMHSKRSDLLEKIERVNYMLPEERNKSREERKVLQELALFERMQQREARRQQHVVSARGSGNTGGTRCSASSANNPLLDSAKVAKVTDSANDGSNSRSRQRYQSSTKKAKNAKGRRRVASSECSSTAALKRSRTMSEGAKWREKSEAEQGLNNNLVRKAISFSPRAQNFITELNSESKMNESVEDVIGMVERRELDVSTNNTTVSCKSSLLCAKREIQNADPIQDSGMATCFTNEKHIKYEVEPLPKRRRESHGINNKSDSDVPGKELYGSKLDCTDSSFVLKQGKLFVYFNVQKLISVRFITEQIRALFRKMVEIEATCKPSDFSLDFQKLKVVQLPLTSLHSECGKNQMKVAEAPKKKMSLDEYKRRKSSKTTADSEKTPAIAIEKTTEDNEYKQMPLSRSFIPLMTASGIGKRTSLRLGALPDPVQLRATPTLSIDDLKRRIYRRTTSSNTVTSNPDGLSLSSLVRKNASHTSPGQCFEEGPVSYTSSFSSTWRRELPSTVASNKDKRLPLEERLRLVLGCGERYAGKYSSSVSPPAAPPPPPPPPPPLPIKNSEIPKLRCDLSADVHSDIPLPPPPPMPTPSCSQPDQCSCEVHAFGPRRG
ncbi:PHD-finger family protein [Brugia pahangi]